MSQNEANDEYAALVFTLTCFGRSPAVPVEVVNLCTPGNVQGGFIIAKSSHIWFALKCVASRVPLGYGAGDPDGVGVEYLEVFCNPNAYSTAFEAKLLITLATQQGLKVTMEARLSAVKSDIDHFVESHP